MQNTLLFSYAGHYRHSQVLWHSHRGIELIYVASGECTCEFKDHDTVTGKTGSCFVIPPELWHGQTDTPDCATRYIVFEDNAGSFNASLRKIETGKDPLVRQWFENLFRLDKSCETDQASLLMLPLLRRLEAIEENHNRKNNLHPALQKAVAHIEEHLMQYFPISELARLCCVSQGHLNMLFQNEFGMGANHYILSMRMRLARQLLLNTYYTISEVAGLCGFAGGNYFTRAFKLYYGVAPGKYRENPAAYADCLFGEPPKTP